MIQLNYRDARPIYSQIADDLRQQILLGILVEGDKLPSVRELAGQLTINPNTIQRAYRELENQGWIVTVPGKGCFVAGGQNALTQKQNELLENFDATVASLMELGISRKELLNRLSTGGTENA